jgi:hypothetical protein
MMLDCGTRRRIKTMAHALDTLARRLAPLVDRRTLLGAIAGSTAASLVPALALPGSAKKKKKKKGKGKKQNKKKCKGGTRPCGKRCIPKDQCCKHTDCDICSHELCENGRCGCTGGRIRSNGVCGFFPNCKSVGLICTNDDECCSRKCDIWDGVYRRCNKSTELCIVDIDCESGNCRGFMCPEFLAMTLDGLC